MGAILYNAEISPASSRGFLTSFPEVCINVGILFGYVSNYTFSKLPLSIGWRLMLGIGAIPSVFLVFAVLAMPESPQWLVMQGRLGEAKIVLEKTLDTKEEAQLRLNDIKEAAGIRQDSVAADVVVPKQPHGKGVWRDMFIHPPLNTPSGFISSNKHPESTPSFCTVQGFSKKPGSDQQTTSYSRRWPSGFARHSSSW
ncbi:hypothetical protein V6N11_068531 [Hibiscus sabdariffa]|uniref:Major facilitator superfamily (MFS) profile domain-containing protein n=1 Tax=Hibiscus sabdariffa TaxID=183260 RepID=A0ABR2PAB0_9ROSI